jgi:hypothetical protein
VEKNARNRNRSERCDLFSSAWKRKRERKSDTQRERMREREREKGRMSNSKSSSVNLKQMHRDVDFFVF